jgi:pimeloyl-ACP methyl ester carboxylesterase
MTTNTAATPQLRYAHANGIRLAYFERNRPEPGRPTLLFVHCTGFHGRVWDRIVEAFPKPHTIALELRGHGRSDKHAVTHWDIFGQDIAAFVSVLQLERVIGVGHSLGAHALVDAAALTQSSGARSLQDPAAKAPAFQRLVLCDPTIAEPSAYGRPPSFLKEGDMHPAARRRAQFATTAEMQAQLHGKGSYPLFETRVFNDYCQHGLLPNGEGQFELACPPAVEASVYMAARTNMGVFDSVRALEIPVHILRAKLPPAERTAFDFSSSPTWPELVHEFKHGTEEHLADCTHFIPMQMPARVIEAVRNALSA